MDSEDERDKQMDQRLPTLVPGRKVDFTFTNEKIQRGRKSVWVEKVSVGFILNMLMI